MKLRELPLIFSGENGGGGAERDPLPASHGNLPRGVSGNSETQGIVTVLRDEIEEKLSG